MEKLFGMEESDISDILEYGYYKPARLFYECYVYIYWFIKYIELHKWREWYFSKLIDVDTMHLLNPSIMSTILLSFKENWNHGR